MKDPSGLYPYNLCRLNDYNGDVSKDWYIIYYIWNIDKQKKDRKRVSTLNAYTTAPKRYKEAEKIIKQIDAMLITGAFTSNEPYKSADEEVDVKGMSVSKAFEYASKIRSKKLKFTRYSTGIVARLKEWESTSGSIPFILFRKPKILSFLDYLVDVRKITGKTYNNYKGEISAVLNFFADRYPDLIKNDAEDIKNEDYESEGSTPFTQQQLSVIVAYCEKIINGPDPIRAKRYDQLLFFIKLAYYTMARPSKEISFLQVKHLREDAVYFPPDLCKNKRGKHPMLSPEIIKLIQVKKIKTFPPDYYIFSHQYQPGPSPVGGDYFYNLFKRVLKGVGLTYDKFNLYSLKPTGACAWFDAGADIKDIQMQMGHDSPRSTDIYLQKLGRVKSPRIGLFPEFGKI